MKPDKWDENKKFHEWWDAGKDYFGHERT